MTKDPRSSVDTGLVSADESRPAELDLLDVFIGRWITAGETVASGSTQAVRIVASDIYEWMPGRHFIMHPVYGHFGDVPVGGLEIIGFDPSTGQFRTDFFDSYGNRASQSLSLEDGVWIWRGEHARCFGTLSADRKSLVARHERSEGGNWVPSMTVTLRRCD